MHIVNNTQLVAQLVVAQAQVVAYLHYANDAQSVGGMNEAIRQVNELEALRSRLQAGIPELAKLSGWHCVCYS